MPRHAGDLRDPQDHPIDVAAVDRLPQNGAQYQGSSVRSPRQASRTRSAGTCYRHGGGLGAFADQVQDPVSAKRFLVVLDLDGRGFGGAGR
jgi:hypothetical protein